MALAIRRRHTPVYYAQQIISAISYIRQQRQIPNFERISRYLQRYAEITPRQCKEHLNNAVSDGLIVEYSAIVSKGQRTGLEQEGYRIPQPGEVEQLDDGHDWYCFECHMPGEVYECNSCFRVYHQGCTREDTTGDIFTCSVCRDNQASRKRNKMKKRMLNTLLSYTILHLREKTRELHKLGTKASAAEFKRYVFKKMDLNRMELKVQASRYKCLEEFHADARTILHNCTLIFGEQKGGMTDLAALMVRDCKYDLDEIELCPNCYYMSNAKPEDWFSQPCNPPHDIVYAKQKGYSYWPAKVVRDLGGKSDVRFFGGWHQRAVIPAEYIKPITTDLKSMAIKKTAGFTKAMKELRRYEAIFEERERERERNGVEESGEEEETEEAEEEEELPEEGEQEEEDSISQKRSSFKLDATTEEEIDEEEEEEEPKEFIRTPQKKTAQRRRNSSHGKASGKKAQKRIKDEVEDDDYDRQVSSTSAEKNAKKRKKSPHKQHSLEESYTVSSSGDHKSITIAPVLTNSTSTQTINVAMETTSVQTDLLMDIPKTEEDVAETHSIDSKAVDQHDKPSEPQRTMDDQLWEERMASAMAELTKRLEEKFEEDKNAALLEQSRQLEEDFGKDKQQAVERTIASMKLEVEKAKKAAEDKAREQYMEEMKKLAAKHKEAISQTKKKQWCQYCEDEAMYHCCWNTSYCSVKCQQDHWHTDHKRVCRRKRTHE